LVIADWELIADRELIADWQPIAIGSRHGYTDPRSGSKHPIARALIPREVIMNRRSVFLAAACLLAALTPALAFAQAKPATTAPPPAAPAKWVPPQKGEGTVDYIQTKPVRLKGEIVTKIKVKNTSKGSLGLLSVEEIWYNTKREIATNGIYRHRALLNPGETIEFEIKSQDKPDLYTNMLMFKHANGTIKPTKVTKFQ
jgi:hypothetical protein